MILPSRTNWSGINLIHLEYKLVFLGDILHRKPLRPIGIISSEEVRHHFYADGSMPAPQVQVDLAYISTTPVVQVRGLSPTMSFYLDELRWISSLFRLTLQAPLPHIM